MSATRPRRTSKRQGRHASLPSVPVMRSRSGLDQKNAPPKLRQPPRGEPQPVFAGGGGGAQANRGSALSAARGIAAQRRRSTGSFLNPIQMLDQGRAGQPNEARPTAVGRRQSLPTSVLVDDLSSMALSGAVGHALTPQRRLSDPRGASSDNLMALGAAAGRPPQIQLPPHGAMSLVAMDTSGGGGGAAAAAAAPAKAAARARANSGKNKARAPNNPNGIDLLSGLAYARVDHLSGLPYARDNNAWQRADDNAGRPEPPMLAATRMLPPLLGLRDGKAPPTLWHLMSAAVKSRCDRRVKEVEVLCHYCRCDFDLLFRKVADLLAQSPPAASARRQAEEEDGFKMPPFVQELYDGLRSAPGAVCILNCLKGVYSCEANEAFSSCVLKPTAVMERMNSGGRFGEPFIRFVHPDDLEEFTNHLASLYFDLDSNGTSETQVMARLLIKRTVWKVCRCRFRLAVEDGGNRMAVIMWALMVPFNPKYVVPPSYLTPQQAADLGLKAVY